ncbi:MAG: hypothetical protein MHPSP_003418, partial [Paramarteilia canceri]
AIKTVNTVDELEANLNSEFSDVPTEVNSDNNVCVEDEIQPEQSDFVGIFKFSELNLIASRCAI